MSQLFIADMSNEEYHGGHGVSKSTLDLVHRDLYAPEWSKACPQDKDKLKTLDFGDAMHAICLEPDRLDSEFIVMPAFNLRTNDGKASKKAFELEHDNHKILTSDEHFKLKLMFESVMAHPQARRLIEAEGVAEGSYFWDDEQTGITCKCRPDKHLVSEGLLVDVKTTPDLKKFCYSVDDYRYYVQDPWYCDGISRFHGETRMEFLAIQKTIELGKYPVMVVRLPQEAIEYGRAVYREDLNRYADFINSDRSWGTKELPMHYNFLNKAYEKITEVEL